MKTYADASVENTWDALEMMYRLFRNVALHVAAHFSFEYPEGDDQRVSAHLKSVRMLPKNATELY
jgi:aminoglycoside 6-adenylyltransferase